jgi:predicted RNase H-like HicB family nuclease
MKFKALIRKGVDFGYVAEVPSLPGCVSQGDTVQDAISNIREAIALYIEDMAPKDIEVASESNPELYDIAV